MACQAQQTPTPSDAKIEDLSTILAPLFNPNAAQPNTSTSHQTSIQSPASIDETETQSSLSTSLDTLLEVEETYQVPERINLPELPDLGNNIWPENYNEEWRTLAESSSDQNSPANSFQNEILNLPPNAQIFGNSTELPVQPAQIMPPMPPPPPYPVEFCEHSRSNSVPANMYFCASDAFNSSLE